MQHDRFRSWALPALAVAAAGLTLTLEAQPRSTGGDVDWSWRRGIALYRDAGFTGHREIFYDDESDLRNNRIGAGAASSIRVAPGCRAILYSGTGYRGRSTEIGDDARHLGETRAGNDAVSSLRVRCGGDVRQDDPRSNDPWNSSNDPWTSRRNDRPDDRRDAGRDPGSGGWNPRSDPAGEDRKAGATLFAGGDYRGRSQTFHGDVARLAGTEVGNDTVSSVQVAPGCRLALFEHPDYQGHSTVLDGDVPDMRATSLGNDRASSLRLECDRRGYGGGYRDQPGERGGVTLYRDVDFRGRGETFYRNARSLGETEIGNDTVRSVHVAPGCRAVLYRHNDYRGESTLITRDAESLRFTAVGNDEASSIEVDCR